MWGSLKWTILFLFDKNQQNESQRKITSRTVFKLHVRIAFSNFNPEYITPLNKKYSLNYYIAFIFNHSKRAYGGVMLRQA